MRPRFAARHGARRAGFTLLVLLALTAVDHLSAARQTNPPTRRGPDNAVVTILEFSDFECPFCSRMPPVIDQLLQAYPDQVRLIFKHLPLPMHPSAPLAHEAALAAAAQGQFWPMHNLLFANQAHLTREDLTRYAAQLHLNPESFARALDTHVYRPAVSDDAAEAMALGITATPTFFVNGRRLVGVQTLASLRAAVEEALGRIGPGTPSVAPARLNINSAPARGTASAPVTIVEFSDLQCPFCAQANRTLNDLLKIYQGRVRVAFKHFPLDMHPKAPLAHRAALAAGEQGKFWEMQDVIFSDQARATREDFIAIAQRLGLDMRRFEADLASDRFGSVIRRDKDEGDQLSIDGTPAFFINGTRLDGARPLADFRAVIDRELAKAGVQSDSRLDAANRTFGAPTAPITLTWFGDLRSPLSAETLRLVKQTVGGYSDKVRVVYKHLPLASRPESVVAYDAALAAGAQGRFWEMQELLAANPDAKTIDALLLLGKRLSLDQTRFETDLRSRTYRAIAEDDLADARRRDVRGTPAFFVDDERIDGLVTPEEFKQVLTRHLR